MRNRKILFSGGLKDITGSDSYRRSRLSDEESGHFSLQKSAKIKRTGYKSQFSKGIEWIKEGKKVAVTFGKKKEIVEYFIPKLPSSLKKRTLGIMEGKAYAVFHKDFKISEEEFLQQ